MAEPEALARGYYAAVDAGDYDRLSDLLTPGFTQVRSDRTLEGRDAFVRFMRDERPNRDTTHEVVAVFRGTGAVAVEGRLRRADGSVSFGFVDVFDVADGRLAGLRTYANRRIGSASTD